MNLRTAPEKEHEWIPPPRVESPDVGAEAPGKNVSSKPTIQTGDSVNMTEGRRLQPVEKPTSVRLLGPVDVAALRVQVARLSEKVWERENAVKENDFFCFIHTRHIIFRFIPLNNTGVCYYSRPIWKVWRRWLLPVMTQTAAAYGYVEPVYPKAMLARVAAGHGIDLHEDRGGMTSLVHKIHVPIETSPQATFTVGSDTFHLEAGSAYEVNNMAPHGAFNGGTRDRIHFIFEMFEGARMEWSPRRWAPGARIPIVNANENDRSLP